MKSNALHLLIFHLLVVFLYPQSLEKDWQENGIRHSASLPLGLSYDGTVLWLADAGNRELFGFDLENNRRIPGRRLQIPELRDLEFKDRHIFTVAPNLLLEIDPINGNVVHKYSIRAADPVGIAASNGIFYIYDREASRIVRFVPSSANELGGFEFRESQIRSMAFTKGTLWALGRNKRIYAISPDDGRILRFLPAPETAYGLEFINGRMYLADTARIHEFDFIETDTFVAANRRRFRFRLTLDINPLYPEEVVKKETSFRFSWAMFPEDAHQRIRNLRGLRAREDRTWTGESKQKQPTRFQTEYTATAETWDATYLIQDIQMSDHFRKSVPSVLLYYTEPDLPEADGIQDPLKKSEVRKLRDESLKNLKDFRKQNQDRHPVLVLSALIHQGLKGKELLNHMRILGVPSREVRCVSLRDKSTVTFPQFYILPAGWLTVTAEYDPDRPKEFPVSADYFAIFIPDDVRAEPGTKDWFRTGAPEIIFDNDNTRSP